MQRAEDFQRLVGLGHRRIHQRRFKSADLPLVVTRATVPGRRHNTLVIVDPGVLDLDPVTKRTAWRFGKAGALGFLRPG